MPRRAARTVEVGGPRRAGAGQGADGGGASAPAPADAVHATTREEWRAWLAVNHARNAGVWLISWKKGIGKLRMEYGDAVEEALCFGWIDSKPNGLDRERTMRWFAPRRPGTGWSRPNKERVERMIAAGRMAPPGLARIAAARHDGSWNALDAVEALQIPDDLGRALAARSNASRHFEAFPRSVKRGILEWIQSAKMPQTHARRIERTAEPANCNERANQWRGK